MTTLITFRSGVKRAWYGLAALCGLVGVVSLRYLVTQGIVPPNVASNHCVSSWIVIHAGASAVALILGPFQFRRSLRFRRPILHRVLGRAYVLGSLLGGGSGVVLAAGVTSGAAARLGFGLLGISWMLSTLLAWHAIINRRIESHRRWMLRSFALCLAAVTLRIYLPLSGLLSIDFRVAYGAISWLSWVPNAAIIELFIALSPMTPNIEGGEHVS